MFFEKLNKMSSEIGQRAVAKRIGTTQATVSRLSRGAHEPRGALLLKLQEVLEVPVGDILNEIHEKKIEIETEGSKKPR